MQCDETINHMVTAGRSYFRTLRNACMTAVKTTMTAGKIYHGCFEMLSWPHHTSANIVNIRFWLLETIYRGKQTTWRSTVGLWSEVRVYRTPAACTWASFQTTSAWCVEHEPDSKSLAWLTTLHHVKGFILWVLLYLHNDTKLYLRLNQNAQRWIGKKHQVSPLTWKECPKNLDVMHFSGVRIWKFCNRIGSRIFL